ncbi:MAG: ATP-binding cassette domain-containing protein [Firmicutes bacterium]|nr:ATP-binding cassette domain-containing protein [Bacillota bacterium]
MPLVEVMGLSKHFEVRQSPISRLLGAKRRVIRAVDGVDFSVNEGETLGLVGESGCGKSTVTRCVVGLTRPTAGKVTFSGLDVSTIRGDDLRKFRRSAQIVFQNPYASLNPRKTVSQILGQALVQGGLTNRAEREAEIVRLIESGIAIARALAVHPRFLVCDEPVSALDVSVQAQILNLLMNLQADYHLTERCTREEPSLTVSSSGHSVACHSYE